MQALILATGENAKLLPLTETLPTPMVPIANQPVMAYPVELLSRYGIKEILISLHHLAGSVEAYFSEGRRWGVRFEYILQRDPLGNGGAISWASAQINEPLIVFPGDQLLDIDLEPIVAAHQQNNAAVTILLHTENKKQDSTRFSVDENGRVSSEPTDLAGYSTGFFILSPDAIDRIPFGQKYDLGTDLIPALLADNQSVQAVFMDGYWNPLHTFQQYEALQKLYLDSAAQKVAPDSALAPLNFPSMDGVRMGEQVWAGRHNMIHPTVKIVPPISIGEYCQIGRDVELGPYAVIGSNVIIDDEASVVNSTVISNTYVGKLVNIENRFISRNMMVDAATSESLEIVDRFLIGEANPSLVNSDFRRFVDGTMAIVLTVLLLPLFVLIGFLTLITTGKLFTRVTKMGVLPRTLAIGGRREPVEFVLLQFAIKRNGSTTRFGRWLQQSGLNRLPELINVAGGSIGLVGVKPLSPDESQKITEEWQLKRFEYMAGFTGLWYVQNTPDSSLDEVVISDVYYVATRTWREDLRILRRTPGRWLRRLIGRVK